jgi:hypothetical protein
MRSCHWNCSVLDVVRIASLNPRRILIISSNRRHHHHHHHHHRRRHWQNSPFWTTAFLKTESTGLHPVFTYLDFATIIIFTEQGRETCVQTPNLDDQVSICMSSNNSVAQLYPQASGYLFVTFHVSQGYSGGILTRLHTGLTSVQDITLIL